MKTDQVIAVIEIAIKALETEKDVLKKGGSIIPTFDGLCAALRRTRKVATALDAIAIEWGANGDGLSFTDSIGESACYIEAAEEALAHEKQPQVWSPKLDKVV